MESRFAWLAFSERERNQAQAALRLLREPGTRDELGIGIVRDAISDALFPGTSTIQTRAAYFLFVPWLCMRAIRKGGSRQSMLERLHRFEQSVIFAIEKTSDRDGNIGAEAKASLKRYPSSVYWAGLRAWSIRTFPGSLSQYLDRGARRHGETAADLIADDDDPRPRSERWRSGWDDGLPDPPDGFPDQASFALSIEQAQYLHSAVVHRRRGSLLAEMVRRGAREEGAGYAWDHPICASLPDHLASALDHARCFSELIHGATLLYNLMLSEIMAKHDWVEWYEEDMDKWVDELRAREEALRDWDLAGLWDLVERQNPRFRRGSPTGRFIAAWVELARDGGIGSKCRRDKARTLVREREIEKKKARSRFTNSNARAEWNGDAGTARLDYRWRVVRQLIEDINGPLA